MPSKAMKARKQLKKQQQPTSPSLTSLFSSITKVSNNSNNSNSSNSTVTPESYARQQRIARNTLSKPPSSPSPATPTSHPKQAHPTPPESLVECRPNVFAFMEDDDSDEEQSNESDPDDDEVDEDDDEDEEEESSDEDEDEDGENGDLVKDESAEISRPIPIPSTPRRPDTSDRIPLTPRSRPVSASFHSDSGISVNSSSSDHSSSEGRKVTQVTRRSARPRQLDLDSSPESFYNRPSRSVPQTATYAPQALSQSLVPVQRNRQVESARGPTHPTDLVSKLSATSTSSDSIRPIYRRFEALTNTLLLQLQSELQRLEKDLASVDTTLQTPPEPSPRPTKRSSTPLSLEQRTHLEWRRAELFGLLGGKLEQYHRALTSYHSLSRVASPDPEAVEKLKQLIRASPLSAEFLARLEDLATLSPEQSQGQGGQQLVRSSVVAADRARRDERESALFTGGAVLLTILAFKFVPKFIARVVLGAIVLGGMIGCGMLPELGDRWRRQVGVYAGVVVCLAVVVG